MMAIREISIPVTSEIASAYEHASEQERMLAIRMFGGFLRPVSREVVEAEFEESRKRLSDQAIANGLTPEILEEILADEK